MVHKIESLPEMIAILEFGHRGTGDEKVDHQNRPEFSHLLLPYLHAVFGGEIELVSRLDIVETVPVVL